MRSGDRKLLAGLMTAVVLLMGTAAAVPSALADSIIDWIYDGAVCEHPDMDKVEALQALFPGGYFYQVMLYSASNNRFGWVIGSPVPLQGVVSDNLLWILDMLGNEVTEDKSVNSSSSEPQSMSSSLWFQPGTVPVFRELGSGGCVEYYNAITGSWVSAVKEGTPGGYPRYRIDTKRDIKVRVKGYDFVTVFGQVNGAHVADDQAVSATEWTEFTVPASSIEWRYSTSAWVYGGSASQVPVLADGEQWLIPIEYSVEGVYGFFQGVTDGFRFYSKDVTFTGGIFNRPAGATYHCKITREITGELIDYRNLVIDSSGVFNVSLSVPEDGEYRLVLVQDLGGTLTVLQELRGFIGEGYVPDDGGPDPEASLFEKLIYWISTPIREASRLLSIALEGVQSLVDPAGPLLSLMGASFAWMPTEVRSALFTMIIVAVVVGIWRLIRR